MEITSTMQSNAENSALQETENPGVVLIVDDIAANVRLLNGILRVAGYDTISATSGLEALEKLGEQIPDVVLLDVMMPGMDGFEVCRRIRASREYSHLPVVMVTALQSTEDRVQAIEAGADDFLTKPVEAVEVTARVKSLVRVKRQREALDKAYRELQRAESMRDSLTEMLVHDLRTPLTTIIGPLEMLQNEQFGSLSEVQKEIASMSTRSGHRLLGIVNALLDVSKMESGQMILERTPVSAAQIAREAIEQVAFIDADGQASVLREVPDDLPSFAADADLLRRVLVNLIGNAMKFTPSDGTVVLNARAASAADQELPTSLRDGAADHNGEAELPLILFSVTDTGEGIPEADREKVFDKFGQVESRKEGRKMSTGLGLTFCRLAVEAHGGAIWVRSELGKGSTFSFALPL